MRNKALFLTLTIILFSTQGVQAEPAETEIPGVTAEVVELRQSGGVLRLALRFKNNSSTEVSGHSIEFAKVVLLDARTKQKHIGIRDADGHYLAGPVSDWNDGGRWWLRLPPQGEAILWMMFGPVAPGTVLTVEIPLAFPFDDIPVTEGPTSLLAANVATSTPSALRGTLVSAKRADQELKVRLKLEREGVNSTDIGALQYRDVYVFDPVSKRKYVLFKDADGQYIAQPKGDSDNGGRFWLREVAAGSATLMSLTFVAPPDDVTSVDLVLPSFVPFEGIALSGEGGAAAGGIATAGRTIGLEAALKELQAEVTPQEIKIDLAADVLFDFDKADLKPVAEEKLNHLLTVVNSRPDFVVSIEGHTDTRGDAAYNQALSMRRANSVLDWLSTHGVAANRLTAAGAGETRPLKSGETEADHQANRRVEIRMKGSTAATAAGTQPAIQLQPGKWRLHVVSAVNGVADPIQDTDVCISAEELSDLGSYFAPVLEEVEADCRSTRQPSPDPLKVDYRMSCTGHKFTLEASSLVAIENATRFAATLRIDTRNEGEPLRRAEAKAEANWASECDQAQASQ